MKDKFITYLRVEKKYSENTINSYNEDIERFSEYLDSQNIDVRKCNKEVVRDYLKYLDSLKLKNSSISRNMSSLRTYFDYLVTHGYVDTNPIRGMKNPKKEKKLPNFLSYEEFLKLLEAIKSDDALSVRNKLIVEMLFATGVRVSELCNIKLDDIDYRNQSIRIIGKGSKERVVYYGAYAKDLLEEYIGYERSILLKGKKSDYLLINNKSTPLLRGGVEMIIDEIAFKASLKNKISPHVLRHTFATIMLNEGADIRIVQELLGHASLSTTGIYTHVTTDALKAEYLKAFPRK